MGTLSFIGGVMVTVWIIGHVLPLAIFVTMVIIDTIVQKVSK